MNLILRRFNKTFGFVWIVLSGIQQKTGKTDRKLLFGDKMRAVQVTRII